MTFSVYVVTDPCLTYKRLQSCRLRALLGLPLQAPQIPPKLQGGSGHANLGGFNGGGGGSGGETARKQDMQGGQALFAHGFAMDAEHSMHQVSCNCNRFVTIACAACELVLSKDRPFVAWV